MGGHPEESEEDAAMEAFLQLVHLRMAIPECVELARGRAQVGIQTLLQGLIKYHLARGKGSKMGRRECHTFTACAHEQPS